MQTQCSHRRPLSCPLPELPGAVVPRLRGAAAAHQRCQKPFAATVKDIPHSRAYLEMISFPFSSYITLVLPSKHSHFPLNLYTSVRFSKQRGANNRMPLQLVEISARNRGWVWFLQTQSCVMGFTCRRGTKDTPTVLG